jgi:hypothetical protein
MQASSSPDKEEQGQGDKGRVEDLPKEMAELDQQQAMIQLAFTCKAWYGSTAAEQLGHNCTQAMSPAEGGDMSHSDQSQQPAPAEAQSTAQHGGKADMQAALHAALQPALSLLYNPTHTASGDRGGYTLQPMTWGAWTKRDGIDMGMTC